MNISISTNQSMADHQMRVQRYQANSTKTDESSFGGCVCEGGEGEGRGRGELFLWNASR